jgi:hypothetical protein
MCTKLHYFVVDGGSGRLFGSKLRLDCIKADFSECIIDSENLSSFLKMKGGLNVPDSVKSEEMLRAKIFEWNTLIFIVVNNREIQSEQMSEPSNVHWSVIKP